MTDNATIIINETPANPDALFDPDQYLIADMERARNGLMDGVARLEQQRNEVIAAHQERIAALDARIAQLRAAYQTPAEVIAVASRGDALADRIAAVLRECEGQMAPAGELARRVGHKRAGGIVMMAQRCGDRFVTRSIGGVTHLALKP